MGKGGDISLRSILRQFTVTETLSATSSSSRTQNVFASNPSPAPPPPPPSSTRHGSLWLAKFSIYVVILYVKSSPCKARFARCHSRLEHLGTNRVTKVSFPAGSGNFPFSKISRNVLRTIYRCKRYHLFIDFVIQAFEIEHFQKYNTRKRNVPKCGAGDGWRRSVGPIV